jgi:carbamoyltransferase
MANDKKWTTLFGFKRRNEKEELQQHHCNLAWAIQQVTEEIVLKLAAYAKELTGAKKLCLAGGVALNCVANGKLQNSGLFDELYIQPAGGDAGGAAGAAWAAYHIYKKQSRTIQLPDGMNGSYLGPHFNEEEIITTLNHYGAKYNRFNSAAELNNAVASFIEKGNVVGWFKGRMEYGPRALGNRSILADARNADMQKKLNLKIKFREGFRPFAPAVIAEDAQEYFELKTNSPYMLLVQPVKKQLQHVLPANYHSLPLQEKLYYQRSTLPAVTHIDFSARIQTVHKETNPEFYGLLTAFKQLTGCSVLINTSFNVRGEPVVHTPAEAYQCFMRTEMDYLVIENFLLAKTDQPEWKEKEEWKKITLTD